MNIRGLHGIDSSPQKKYLKKRQTKIQYKHYKVLARHRKSSLSCQSVVSFVSSTSGFSICIEFNSIVLISNPSASKNTPLTEKSFYQYFPLIKESVEENRSQ